MGVCSSSSEKAREDPSSPYRSSQDEIKIHLIHSEPIHCLCVADSTHLITASVDKQIFVYNWTNHVLENALTIPSKAATKIVYNNSSQWIHAGSRDGKVYNWKWPRNVGGESSGEQLRQCPENVFTEHKLGVMALACTGSRAHLLMSGSRDNSVKIWDVPTGKCTASSEIPRNLSTEMKWIQGEDNVVQSSEDKTLRIWDIRTCSTVQQTPPKQHIQLCCNVSPCGNYLLSGSNGQRDEGAELTLWDRRFFDHEKRRSGQIIEYYGHTGNVNSCLFLGQLHNNNIIASCSNDSTICLWDKISGDCMISEYMSGAGPISAIVSPSSMLLACSTFYEGVNIWGVSKVGNDKPALLHLRAKY